MSVLFPGEKRAAFNREGWPCSQAYPPKKLKQIAAICRQRNRLGFSLSLLSSHKKQQKTVSFKLLLLGFQFTADL